MPNLNLPLKRGKKSFKSKWPQLYNDNFVLYPQHYIIISKCILIFRKSNGDGWKFKSLSSLKSAIKLACLSKVLKFNVCRQYLTVKWALTWIGWIGTRTPSWSVFTCRASDVNIGKVRASVWEKQFGFVVWGRTEYGSIWTGTCWWQNWLKLSTTFLIRPVNYTIEDFW